MTVTDGKITVSSDPIYNPDPTVLNNKIDFIEIYAAPAAQTPQVSAARAAAGGLTITFVGTLQSADQVTGPWTDVSGASPLTVNPSRTMKFYRAKQ